MFDSSLEYNKRIYTTQSWKLLETTKISWNSTFTDRYIHVWTSPKLWQLANRAQIDWNCYATCWSCTKSTSLFVSQVTSIYLKQHWLKKHINLWYVHELYKVLKKRITFFRLTQLCSFPPNIWWIWNVYTEMVRKKIFVWKSSLQWNCSEIDSTLKKRQKLHILWCWRAIYTSSIHTKWCNFLVSSQLQIQWRMVWLGYGSVRHRFSQKFTA